MCERERVFDGLADMCLGWWPGAFASCELVVVGCWLVVVIGLVVVGVVVGAVVVVCCVFDVEFAVYVVEFPEVSAAEYWCEALCVEAEEPDARLAVAADVCSDVAFVEVSECWEPFEAGEFAVVHFERDKPDPCGAVEGVELELLWDERADGVGVEPPMEEEEVEPCHADGGGVRGGSWVRSGIAGHDRVTVCRLVV